MRPAPAGLGSSPRHARNAPSPAIAAAKRHQTIEYASMPSSTTLSAIGRSPHSTAVVSESVNPSRVLVGPPDMPVHDSLRAIWGSQPWRNDWPASMFKKKPARGIGLRKHRRPSRHSSAAACAARSTGPCASRDSTSSSASSAACGSPRRFPTRSNSTSRTAVARRSWCGSRTGRAAARSSFPPAPCRWCSKRSRPARASSCAPPSTTTASATTRRTASTS